MNHLRELFELGTSNARHGHGWARPLLRGAMCFFVGTKSESSQLTPIDELVRVPFPLCWFEYVDYSDSGKKATVCHFVYELPQSLDRATYHCIYVRTANPIEWNLMLVRSCSTDLKVSKEIVFRFDGLTDKMIEKETHVVRCFLSALHCVNVTKKEHKPSEKLQAARMKRGKQPLFSYWTLQLNGKSARGTDHGGTHLSPRVHLRRGHPRQYTPGKWTWVQAHAVGSRAAGVVHKDYSAGPALTAAAQESSTR